MERNNSTIGHEPVNIDKDSLDQALGIVRLEKEYAIDDQNFEKAAYWRDIEKDLIYAIARNGFIRI